MKGLFSIFHLEILAAVRSKAVVVLSTLALAWMFVSPFLLKSDGTVAGYFELRVRYSLGVVFALTLLSLAAAAAGTRAKDRAAMRLQLTLVRPLPRFQVAWGRILALTLIGAVVLGAASLVLWGTMKPLVAESGYGATCDHVIAPTLDPPQEEVDRRMAEFREKNPEFIEKTGEREMRAYLFDYVTSRYRTVRPGETNVFSFAARPAGAVAVRIRLTDVLDRFDNTDIRFTFGPYFGSLSHVNKTLLKVPLAWTEGGSVRSPNGQEPGHLILENRGSRNVSLCPFRDIHLLVEADSFGWNIFRAWIVLTSLVALLVALAVFLGAALSRSVAIFVTMSLLFIMSVSPALIETYPDPSAFDTLDRVSMRLTEFAAHATRPLSAYAPIAALASTSAIESREVASAALWNLVVLPLVFSVLSGLVMVRKQDGM